MSAASRATNLRLTGGRLAPCPGTPNCVCSEAPAADFGHAIAPFAFVGSAAAAWRALCDVVAGRPRVRIVLRTPDDVHAEFTSLLFRFVDDVEFRLDGAAGVIHVRSASRVGYSDLGANRRRIEALRVSFAERLALGGAPGA